MRALMPCIEGALGSLGVETVRMIQDGGSPGMSQQVDGCVCLSSPTSTAIRCVPSMAHIPSSIRREMQEQQLKQDRQETEIQSLLR